MKRKFEGRVKNQYSNILEIEIDESEAHEIDFTDGKVTIEMDVVYNIDM